MSSDDEEPTDAGRRSVARRLLARPGTCRHVEALTSEVRDLQRQVEALHASAEVPRDLVAAVHSLLDELAPADGPGGAGPALRLRLEHGLLHAEAVVAEVQQHFADELGYVRSTTRLTQALVERALESSAPAREDVAASTQPAHTFTHPSPSFDLLYRSFEDQHRGAPEDLVERFRDDYLDDLRSLPNPSLPIADLGCGRGELVRLLGDAGATAVGVDSNTGQVDGDLHDRLVEADMFAWLDERRDASLRAVVALHVVEHLPLELQVRLVFEAHRTLAAGGLLIIETPNALSISTAASSFWADPTHARPVHPAFLELLAHEAGFRRSEVRSLHDVPVEFRGSNAAPELAQDLSSLLLGARDVALVAER